ncbi:tubulin binding cofactor C-domain-containing protein [Hyaloraphidium curvatum]|nr:tubulin binding cofactor C-domain-containing protein [Hyaloraphidium curvatum]
MAAESVHQDAKSAAAAYWARFQNDKKTIHSDLGAVVPTAPDAADALDRINTRLSEMEKEYTAAMGVLSAYDQRQCGEQLRELSAAYSAKRAELKPKSKFAFKSKKPAETKAAEAISEAPAKPPVQPAPPAAARQASRPEPPPGSISFSNLQDELITLTLDQFSQPRGDVYLSALKRCVVDLRLLGGGASVSRVQADGIEGCTVLTGNVGGSVLIYGSKDTVWAIRSQQVRIHDAIDTDFYLLVASKPIIETSRGLRFAPLGPDSAGTINRWSEVEDFNWLRKQASPNWCVVDDGERIQDFDALIAGKKAGRPGPEQ